MSVYYVSKADGSDSYNGLLDHHTTGSIGPWLTIMHGNGRLSPGDTLVVRSGTYQEAIAWTSAGTAGSRISIQNYPNETPIVDGNWTLPGGGSYYNFLVNINADYVTLQGIAARNSSGALVVLNGNYVYGINIAGSYCMESGLIAGWTGCVFDGCTMTKNGQMLDPSSPHYDASWQYGWGSAIATVGTDTIIQNCVSHNNWGEGFNAYSSAHNSTIQDCTSYDNQAINFYQDSTNGGTVRRNIVYSTGVYNQYGMTIGAESGQPLSMSVYNNLVIGCKVNFHIDSNVTDLSNVHVMYNTFVNSTGNAGDGYNMGVYYRPNATTFSGSIFENNIVIEEVAGRVPISCPSSHSGLTFSYNGWSKAPIATCQGTGDVTVDPKITKTGSFTPGNLTAAYFKLQASSPCINKAAILAEVTTDYYGVDRDGAPDMGACEYNSPTTHIYEGIKVKVS